MRLLRTSILLVVILLYINPDSKGQVSGFNIAEFQFGNIPGDEPKSLSTLYDQLNLAYRHKGLLLKGRIEAFQPSHFEERAYRKLNQFSAQYSVKGFKVQAGSMYHTIGRGILMRNYEQPSSIWENVGYRVRYGFYKDMQGVAASYTKNNFRVKVLRGKVLAVDLPPTLEYQERRPDLVEAAEANYTLLDQTIGLAYMRHTNYGESANYATAYLDGYYNLLSWYGEYAFGGEESRAAYASLSFAGDRLGISLEYKNYKNFLLGAGIGDPPTLVKEHSSRLLNRSTHVPILTNESGYQAELSFQTGETGRISLNHSMAKNQISDDLQFTFNEFYLDYESFIGESWYGKLFADYATDPFKSEIKRYTGGIILEKEIKDFTLGLDLEAQSIERDFGEERKFMNYYSSVSISKGSKFGFSIIYEWSDDPFLLEEGEKHINYPGLILNYQPVHSTKLSLFAGKRRGGPACNSGVCYEVLDFEGIELRITTTF